MGWNHQLDVVKSLTYSSNKWPEDFSNQRPDAPASREDGNEGSHLEVIGRSRTFNMYLVEMPHLFSFMWQLDNACRPYFFFLLDSD